MRRFLNLKKIDTKEEQTSTPSLPNDLSYEQLIHMTKRGYIARKIASYLEMDQFEQDNLFFQSLSEITLDSLADENPYIFYSECLLSWVRNGDDIKKKIDELALNNQLKNALFKVYDIHKNYLLDKPLKENIVSQTKVNEKWQVYRDVMYSATQGKFLLINKEEVEGLKIGTILVEEEIKVLADIPKCRTAVKTKLELIGYNKSELMSWLLVISEAITNTLKHAEEGKMLLVEDKGKRELRVIVEDKGSGFDLEYLPKATLMAGYSTKKSLGQGFQLMLKMANQVFLYTTNQGSTIIVTFEVNRNGDINTYNSLTLS